jgi:probable phosphoglycerate mutase
MHSVWLVRHAQSEGNAGLVSSGLGLAALSPNGRSQAAMLAESLPTAPDLIVVSPFARSVETAASLLARFPDTPLEEWPVQELTILAAALYRGTTQADRGAPVDAYWQRLETDYCSGAGAETFREFMARVDGMLNQVRTRPEAFAVIVTHGYVMQAAIWRLLHPSAPVDATAMAGFWAFSRACSIPNIHVVPLRASEDGAIWMREPRNPANPSIEAFE